MMSFRGCLSHFFNGELTVMDDQSLRIATLGNGQSHEMRPVGVWLEEHVAERNLRHAADVSQLTRLVTEENWYPDLVVVCQHWPDEYTQAEVQRLFALLPLARWVCCYGLWCESDGRNRDVWPAAVRVPARTTEHRLQREWAVLHNEQPALQPTASRDEIFAFDHPRHDTATRVSRHTILVQSPDRPFRKYLQDLLHATGYPVTGDPDEPGWAVVVCDVDPWRDDIAAALRQFRMRQPSVRIVALTNVGCADFRQSLRDAGADAVLPKHLPQSAWTGALEMTLSQPSSGSQALPGNPTSERLRLD